MAGDQNVRYRKAYPRFWRDEKVLPLSPIAKLIAYYCLTGPQSNRCGIYVLSPGAAAEDCGTLPQTFAEGFGEVISALSWRWDEKFRVLYIPRWWKWNAPDNPNILKSCLGDLSEVPECQLLKEFKCNSECLPETLRQTFTQTFTQTRPKPPRNQEQEQEQEQEQDKREDTSRDDGQLRDWLRWWNALHTEGLVSAGVNEERPSEAIRSAWKKAQRSREVRELLAQRQSLDGRVRKSSFCREGWFRLEKLFGAKNRDGELIVRKLLEGGYEDSRVTSPKQKTMPVGPGQVHPEEGDQF